MASNTSQRVSDLKDAASDRLNDNYSNLKENFTQLRTDVVDLLSHAFGVGKSSVNSVGSNVKDKANDAMETLKDQITQLREKGNDQVEAVGKKIEDNPIAATAIAFGIGFVLAKLLSRK